MDVGKRCRIKVDPPTSSLINARTTKNIMASFSQDFFKVKDSLMNACTTEKILFSISLFVIYLFCISFVQTISFQDLFDHFGRYPRHFRIIAKLVTKKASRQYLLEFFNSGSYDAFQITQQLLPKRARALFALINNSM